MLLQGGTSQWISYVAKCWKINDDELCKSMFPVKGKTTAVTKIQCTGNYHGGPKVMS